jgi:hypothetical protein
MITKQEYIDYLKDFSEKVNEEDLKKCGIESIKILQEVMTKEPMMPKLIVKKIDGSEESVWGMEEIAKKLNKIFENV